MSNVKEVIIKSITKENFQNYIFGMKKSGQPRALYDIIKDFIGCNGSKGKKKNKYKGNGDGFSLYLNTKKKKKKKNKKHWHI